MHNAEYKLFECTWHANKAEDNKLMHTFEIGTFHSKKLFATNCLP